MFEPTGNEIKKKFNASPVDKLRFLISLLYANMIKSRITRKAVQDTKLYPLIPYL